MSNPKYSLIIGRFQPFHAGHERLVGQELAKGKKVLIAVRDTPINENNPHEAESVARRIRGKYLLKGFRYNPMVKVIGIPDIDAVFYGRDVGYDNIEHEPPEEVKHISATDIRKRNKKQRPKRIDFDVCHALVNYVDRRAVSMSPSTWGETSPTKIRTFLCNMERRQGAIKADQFTTWLVSQETCKMPGGANINLHFLRALVKRTGKI